MVVVVMGVSGAGKSTIGRALADALGARFVDGDDLHAPEAVAKMHRGEPLDDADRVPWLARVRAVVDDALARGDDCVVVCSALRQAYRDRLALDRDGIRLVYLHAPADVLRARLRARQGHFVHDELLPTQLALLEPPADAIDVDVRGSVADAVAAIRRALGR